MASVPELVKKLFCNLPGVICASFSASATMASLGNNVEVCWSLSTCVLIFEVTLGLQWPSPTVTIPPKKSRYLLPFDVPEILHRATIGDERVLVVIGDRGPQIFLVLADDLFAAGGYALIVCIHRLHPSWGYMERSCSPWYLQQGPLPARLQLRFAS